MGRGALLLAVGGLLAGPAPGAGSGASVPTGGGVLPEPSQDALAAGAASDPIEVGLALGAEGERDAALRLLGELPPDGIARMVALLCRQETLAEDRELEFVERRLVLEALGRAEVAAVVDAARATLGQAPEFQEQLDLLDVLGAVRAEAAIEPMLDVFATIDPQLQQHPIAMRSLERSLASVLEADASGGLLLADHLVQSADSAGLRRVGLRALGAAGDPALLPAFERVLAGCPEHEVDVLVALGGLDVRVSSAGVDRARDLVRSRLFAVAAGVRSAAAAAAGQLCDFEVVPELVELLEDADVRPRAAARIALERITGRNFGDQSALWLSWIEQERRWLESELPELEFELASGELPRSLSALRRLAQRPWHRDRLAEACRVGLESRDEGIVVATCGELAILGGPRAHTVLIELLADRREGVRKAAQVALSRSTGLDLPAEAEPWLAWAERR